MVISEIRDRIESMTRRSAWKRGVAAYALDILADLDPDVDYVGSPADHKMLLNGAQDWAQYSDGGCALIYDDEIAERLCTPSELARKRGGDLPPNGGESWLDVQTRALRQAESLIRRISRYVRLAGE